MNVRETKRRLDEASSTPFGLREEARKSWEHIVSDEIVYVGDVVSSEADPGICVSEGYANGASWVELHLTLGPKRHTHYSAIIERLQLGNSHDRGGKLEVNKGGVDGNPPVLVDVAYCVEPPQKVVCHGIPSMVRLKRFDDPDGPRWHSPGSQLQHPLIPPFLYRKLNRSGRGRGSDLGQAPSQLIESGAKAITAVSNDQWNCARSGHQLDPQEIPLILNIILIGKSIGISLNKSAHLLPERVQVFLRPSGLQVGVSQAHRNSTECEYTQAPHRQSIETDGVGGEAA